MKRIPQKPALHEDLREFDKLPAKTKELMILGDSEEHAVGVKKAALQKNIQRHVAETQQTEKT